jgi:hypothetical protein
MKGTWGCDSGVDPLRGGGGKAGEEEGKRKGRRKGWKGKKGRRREKPPVVKIFGK